MTVSVSLQSFFYLNRPGVMADKISSVATRTTFVAYEEKLEIASSKPVFDFNLFLAAV